MVPLGAGSLEGATQGLAVGDGVDVTVTVGVGCGLALGLGRDVDPHATARAATPASSGPATEPDRVVSRQLRPAPRQCRPA